MSGPSFDREAILTELRSAGVSIGDDAPVDVFGNSREMAAELGALVCEGRKTATASLVWDWESEGASPPTPGDREVVIDWDGAILAVIETTSVEVHPFGEVGADFARDEGEGDLSLDYWRRAHWDFFSAVCASIGREPTESMPVVCQRFRLVYTPG